MSALGGKRTLAGSHLCNEPVEQSFEVLVRNLFRQVGHQMRFWGEVAVDGNIEIATRPDNNSAKVSVRFEIDEESRIC